MAVIRRPDHMLEIILPLVLVAELIMFGGQLFYKKALNKIEAERYHHFLIKALTSCNIWAGFFCVAFGMVIWIIALSFTDLNFIYSFDSLTYVIALFGSRIFLGEKLDRYKVIGTACIVSGLILVVMS